jgi:hypothetical protein
MSLLTAAAAAISSVAHGRSWLAPATHPEISSSNAPVHGSLRSLHDCQRGQASDVLRSAFRDCAVPDAGSRSSPARPRRSPAGEIALPRERWASPSSRWIHSTWRGPNHSLAASCSMRRYQSA